MACTNGVVENFCHTNQAASGWVTINIGAAAGQNATVATWNQVYETLRTIYNFGELGTRNPENIPSNLSTGTKIKVSDYNTVANLIGSSTLTAGTELLTTQLETLNEDISNYFLNGDRCDTCNTACNVGCQVCGQCICHCVTCEFSNQQCW